MKCAQADTFIQLALDGRISPAERARLDVHLDICDACRAAWDQYRRLGRSAADWTRRPALIDDPGGVFTAGIMAQIEASAARAPARGFAVRAGLAALVLTALSFWSGPLMLAHLPPVPALGAVLPPMAWTLDGLGQMPETALQDALGTWRAVATHPAALPEWVPGALVVALTLNGAFVWRARRRMQESAAG